MVEEKNKEVKSKEAKLVEVPTQTTLAFQMEDESLLDDKGLLLRIYNDIQIIKKSIS